jgi:hypothetical protein
MTVANTLAYNDTATFTVVKRFIVLATGAFTIKHFKALIVTVSQ